MLNLTLKRYIARVAGVFLTLLELIQFSVCRIYNLFLLKNMYVHVNTFKQTRPRKAPQLE